MKRSSVYLLFSACLFFWFSCSKPIELKELPKDDRKHSSFREAYPLNWESITTMPVPAGATSVGTPWSYGASSTHFSSDIKNDYSSQDGWVLLYNTFTTELAVPHQYFILYNVYRGLVRYYYYVPSAASYIVSNNIVHKLELKGSALSGSPVPSPLLNYADQRIIDMDNNSIQASKLEPYKVDPGAWYALQFEVAYDKNIQNYNYQSLYLKWPITSNAIQTVNLAGTQSGTLSGALQKTGVDLTLSPSFTGKGSIVVNGKDDADKLNVFQALKDGIKGGITNGVTGVISGFISGLFGSGGGQTSEFKIQTELNVSGTISSNFSISDLDFVIPGYQQNPNVTYTPIYNQPLGVFYLANKPKVRTDKYGTGHLSEFDHTVDMSSIVIDYNPAVTSSASVSVEKVEMLAHVPFGMTPNETIEGVEYLVGDAISTGNVDVDIDGVRITIKVTPNNGRPPVFISKTFKPQRQTVFH